MKQCSQNAKFHKPFYSPPLFSILLFRLNGLKFMGLEDATKPKQVIGQSLSTIRTKSLGWKNTAFPQEPLTKERF